MEMEHHMLLSRSGGASAGDPDDRPSFYKAVGISLAIGSGVFIGVSFVLKKVGLLRANEKYNEVAGEGYGYLRNAYWWGGMTLMIVGEICNFVAYAFVDAILVTPLGALSVVVTTVLSAIFLKERLSMVGKVSCFLCIVGSVVIVMNAPHSSAVRNIQDMQRYVIAPGFLSFAGVVIVGSLVAALWAGPRWGSRNMLVYISICSWVGGLSVVATQGLGAAIIAWIDGAPQYREWFLWVLFVFVVATLLVEIVYLNKALNIFNAALVTPTYYVYFTSTTIITSAILFQGFKGTVEQIVTVVLGFLTICSGVVLLQLSKAAKDVPDTAVFQGDLDQIQTIAEQEQPESEPKADAIRGAAGLVRRFSRARLKMEEDEFRRLHQEKMLDSMQPIAEDGRPQQPEYEWDGLRRRRTGTFSSPRPVTASTANNSHPHPHPPATPVPARSIRSPTHPPLGMSRFPDDLDEYSETRTDQDHDDRSTIFSSIAGSFIRGAGGRARSRTAAPAYYSKYDEEAAGGPPKAGGQASVSLNDVSKSRHLHPHQHPAAADDDDDGKPSPGVGVAYYGYVPGRDDERDDDDDDDDYAFSQQDTAYHGAGSRRNRTRNFSGTGAGPGLHPPTPPPHSARGPRRHFSFNRVFRRAEAPTEEERAGLVIDGEGDTRRDNGDGDGDGDGQRDRREAFV